MDAKRAKEIIASPNTISVLHNGAQIYIEKVNEMNGTASIHPLNNPSSKQDVPLASLIER